jgi:putative ABC transport system permease protein
VSVLKLAWRNIWRNRRRTVVTIAAMTIAMIATINYSGLINGYMHGMERNILDFAFGDIQIHAPGYLDKPSLYKQIENPNELLEKLDAAGLPGSARLLAAGLGALKETSAGVMLIGLDVNRDARVLKIPEQVGRGEWLSDEDSHGVVLGRRLARTLGAQPGDELVILGQAQDGSLANDLFKVRGVLRGVSDMTDRIGVFMPEKTFRELMVMPQGAHQIVVRKPDEVELAAAQEKVAKLAAGLDVQTWRQLNPTLASMLDNVQSVVMVFMSIVYIAIALVILNAMLMAVFERVREFGVLKALGTSPASVLKMIYLESAIQTGIAIAAGMALSIPLILYLSSQGIYLGSEEGLEMMGLAWDPTMRARFDLQSFIRPIVMFVVIVSLAILYPAIKAAMIRPVRAMHHR